MSMAVAAMNADDESTIDSEECVSISFPNFFELLK
jgi:5-enolpyruvylshikimate-3-phosphate synthase